MGKIVVIEGLDGCGKTTQVKRLTAFYKTQGLKVKTFHFPTGEGFAGELINSFLKGDFGAANEVDPYFVAMIYALDRKHMARTLHQWLEEYDLLLLDRYTLSNVAYQCAKLPIFESRMALSSWIFDLEYGINHLPQPDLTLYLGVPLQFVDKQLKRQRRGEERRYLQGKEDVHEIDLDLQREVNEVYTIFCEDWDDILFVNCVDAGGNMLASDTIHEKIVAILKEHQMF